MERSGHRPLGGFGYLAHIVADVAQPIHSDSSEREDGVHSAYKSVADDPCERGEGVYRLSDDAAEGVSS
jgi:hypothetical protein